MSRTLKEIYTEYEAEIDFSGFEEGEWTNEPNRIDFTYKGYDCIILRHPKLGHLNGYIGIPDTHKLFGIDYNSGDNYNLFPNIHGGLTYSSGPHNWVDNGKEHIWWVGFDCAHGGDLCPFFTKDLGIPGIHKDKLGLLGNYRNIEYVISEIKQFIDHLDPS